MRLDGAMWPCGNFILAHEIRAFFGYRGKFFHFFFCGPLPYKKRLFQKAAKDRKKILENMGNFEPIFFNKMQTIPSLIPKKPSFFQKKEIIFYLNV
jgi:hypothetical protein